MKCCICHKSISGYGNNPYGALYLNNKPIIWSKKDRCCDKCNEEIVLPGRILLIINKK